MSDWIWLPHPAHLCVSYACQFRLATVVGGGRHIVSTVGEWFLRQPHQGEPQEIGAGRLYETMVFRAEPVRAACCPYVTTGDNLDLEGYNDAASALVGHMALCRKWDEAQRVERPPLRGES